MKVTFDVKVATYASFLNFYQKRGCHVFDDLYNAASLTRQTPQGFSSNQ